MEKYAKLTILAVFAAIVGYNIYSAQSTVTISDLALSNVEALADGSEGGGITCSRTCSDGIGQCYRLYEAWGKCHFSGYQSDHCTC